MTNDAPERNSLRLANLIRDVVNEALARYDVPSDVYEQDVLIDAACVVTADKIADHAQAEKEAAVAAEREAYAELVAEYENHRSWADWASLYSAIRARGTIDALSARDARVRAEALTDVRRAWEKLRHVAVNNTDDPDEWEALIGGMDAALIPADQEEEE